MKRSVCVVTGTRAEYGLLRNLLRLIAADRELDLQVAVTGAHLSPDHGYTVREIEADGFTVDARIEMLLASDTPSAIAKSTGLGLIGFGEAFARLRPDILVVLGDRYEILAAVEAALFARIPVAHIHGGERTDGAFDDAIRHAITKMSHLHFVAAPPYRDRVIQLGEHPDRVHLVGGLGVDAIFTTDLLDRASVEAALGLPPDARIVLVTFHPETLSEESVDDLAELLAALEELESVKLVFTLPNADTGNRELARRISAFASSHANAQAFPSLGSRLYLSCMKAAAVVVGNSSSGLCEAPSFQVPTVNIGNRQAGRLRAASVIDCVPDRAAVGRALQAALSETFRRSCATVKNPYGDGGASRRIAAVLRDATLDGLLVKSFFDQPERAPR